MNWVFTFNSYNNAIESKIWSCTCFICVELDSSVIVSLIWVPVLFFFKLWCFIWALCYRVLFIWFCCRGTGVLALEGNILCILCFFSIQFVLEMIFESVGPLKGSLGMRACGGWRRFLFFLPLVFFLPYLLSGNSFGLLLIILLTAFQCCIYF